MQLKGNMMLWFIVALVIIVGGGSYLYSAQKGAQNSEFEEAAQNAPSENESVGTEGSGTTETATPASGDPDDAVNDIINQAADDKVLNEADDASSVTSDADLITNIGNAYDASQ